MSVESAMNSLTHFKSYELFNSFQELTQASFRVCLYKFSKVTSLLNPLFALAIQLSFENLGSKIEVNEITASTPVQKEMFSAQRGLYIARAGVVFLSDSKIRPRILKSQMYSHSIHSQFPLALRVEILKSQLATKLTCTMTMYLVLEHCIQVDPNFDPEFSKVSCAAIVCSTFSIQATFENFYQGWTLYSY